MKYYFILSIVIMNMFVATHTMEQRGNEAGSGSSLYSSDGSNLPSQMMIESSRRRRNDQSRTIQEMGKRSAIKGGQRISSQEVANFRNQQTQGVSESMYSSEESELPSHAVTESSRRRTGGQPLMAQQKKQSSAIKVGQSIKPEDVKKFQQKNNT